MTAQTLPDNPNFCFVPAYDVEADVQQIRIVIEGLSGHVPTALVALDLDDALTTATSSTAGSCWTARPGPPWPLPPCAPRTAIPTAALGIRTVKES